MRPGDKVEYSTAGAGRSGSNATVDTFININVAPQYSTKARTVVSLSGEDPQSGILIGFVYSRASSAH